MNSNNDNNSKKSSQSLNNEAISTENEPVDILMETLFYGENPTGYNLEGNILISVEILCQWLGLEPNEEIEKIKNDPHLSKEATYISLDYEDIESGKTTVEKEFCLSYTKTLGWIYSNAIKAKPIDHNKFLTTSHILASTILKHFFSLSAEERENLSSTTFALGRERFFEKYESNIFEGVTNND